MGVFKLREEEKRLLDALLILDEEEAKKLPEHPVRATHPLRAGWLLLGDVEALLLRLRRGREAFFGTDHEKMSHYKLPRVLQSLREARGLTDRETVSYRRKGETHSLYAYRLRRDVETWRRLAGLALDAGQLEKFFKTGYHQTHPTAQQYLQRYQVVTLGDFEDVPALLDFFGGEEEETEWALASPALFGRYLQDPSGVKAQITTLRAELRKVPDADNPGVVLQLLLLGEAYAAGTYARILPPMCALRMILNSNQERREMYEAASPDEQREMRKEAKEAKELQEAWKADSEKIQRGRDGFST